MRALLPLLLLLGACGRDTEPRLLHDVPSPDGRFRVRIVVRPELGGHPDVHLHLETADGKTVLSDAVRVPARPEEITPADFKVRWVSEARVEVKGWKTDRDEAVWQLEEGLWRDRRSWEDRIPR